MIAGSFTRRHGFSENFMDRVTADQDLRLPKTTLRDRKRAREFEVNRNSRGFWLAVCLLLSAVAGWLMFHFGILQ
ncbi:MAG TPA: hypothetical protein VGK80_08015 [Rhodanobacteraceae bacterium]